MRGFILRPNQDAPEFHTPDFAAWTALSHETCCVWCYGEILSYRAQTGQTDLLVSDILDDWQADKLDYPSLNGRFVLIFRDAKTREWHVVTDRVGAMHAYAVWRGERILEIGADLAGVASQHTLNWEAIASFFAFGFFLDDQTYFADTRILWPASVYRLSAEGELLAQRRYWEWSHPVNTARSYDQTLQQYDHLFRQAVTRCTAIGEPMLPLSGGLDSRSIAAVYAGTQSYSYGYTRNSIETTIASKIAQVQGHQFTAHVISPYLFDRLDEAVRALDGSQDVTQARQISVNAWVRARATTVISGLWGDVWCDQMGLADGLPPDMTVVEHTLKKFQKRGRAWLLDTLCKPHLGGMDIQALLKDRISSGYSAFAQIDDLDFRVKAYKTARWAFRWSNASLRGFALGAVPRIPYYDVDLIDFFCTVPTAFVRDRRLQIDHLKRYFPALARIQWQDAGVNLFWLPYRQWLTIAPRAYHKLRRTLLRQKPIQRNWEVQFLSAHGRKRLSAFLLSDGAPLHQYVPKPTIERQLGEFFAAPDATNGYTISMLLTFAAWLSAVFS